MVRIRRFLVATLLMALVPVVGVALFVGPAGAATTSMGLSSSTLVKPHKPCGIKHYPRCPPKHVIGHQHNKKVKQGHRYHLNAKHFGKHKKITVRIKGHGHDKLVFVSHTNKHGKKYFSVTIPKNFKPGTYHVIVKVGSVKKTITIKVTKRHHKHHH